MKKRIISIIFIIFIFSYPIFAEPTDSTFTDIEFLPIDLGHYGHLIDSTIIRSQAEYDSLTSMLREKHFWLKEEPPEIDFEYFTLIGDESFADGSATFSYQVLKDTLDQFINVHVVEHYGGGRGMNVFDHWLLIPKVPDDYSVKFIHSEGELKHNYED